MVDGTLNYFIFINYYAHNPITIKFLYEGAGDKLRICNILCTLIQFRVRMA